MINMISFLVGFLVGILSSLLLRNNYSKKNKVELSKISKIHNDHLKPKYYGYGGAFDNITKCSDCNLVGLRQDLHPSGCCPRCGGKILPFGSGYWGTKDNLLQWIKK